MNVIVTRAPQQNTFFFGFPRKPDFFGGARKLQEKIYLQIGCGLLERRGKTGFAFEDEVLNGPRHLKYTLLYR
jgi:hypothetical protein